MMEKIKNSLRFVKNDDFDNALSILEAASKEEKDPQVLASLHFEIGKIYWKLGKRAMARTHYLKAIDLDPESNARIALEQAGEIESFFNPDLLNP